MNKKVDSCTHPPAPQSYKIPANVRTGDSVGADLCVRPDPSFSVGADTQVRPYSLPCPAVRRWGLRVPYSFMAYLMDQFMLSHREIMELVMMITMIMIW